MKYLYKVTNMLSGKCYIGQTINIEQRWSRHKARSNNRSPALKSAINKYGLEHFEFTILCVGSDKYIDQMEIKAIDAYDSLTPNGYNIALGGKGLGKYLWKEEWNSLLGTMSDRDLALQLDVSSGCIGNRRKALGISPYSKYDPTLFEKYVGVINDCEAAEIIGCSQNAVAEYRKRRQIPAVGGRRRSLKGSTKYDHDLLAKYAGTNTDKKVAEIVGCTSSNVFQYRRHRGIKAFKN